jgi:DNA-binding response OmpR family regulator
MAGRILVVEDDSLTRRALATVLTSEGYSVKSADNGRTAISLIDTGSFDAVLSDLHLGDAIDGLAILSHFNILFPQRVKFLMSGTESDLQSRCAAVGALFFSKPVSLSALLSTLETLIGRLRVADDLLEALTRRSRELRYTMEVNRKRLHDLQRINQELRRAFQELAARFKSEARRLAKKRP